MRVGNSTHWFGSYCTLIDFLVRDGVLHSREYRIPDGVVLHGSLAHVSRWIAERERREVHASR